MNYFKSYNDFIFEGGNARVIDRESGEILAHAEKINLSIFDRSTFIKDVIESLSKINDLYEKKTGRKIWKKFSIVESGKAFSGSTEFFFDLTIPDDEFKKYKSNVGDIDIIIPKDISKDFEDFMPTLENKKLTSKITYLGQDRIDFGTTWLAVFKYISGKKQVNFQIDFEYGDWTNKEEPSEWSKFSHNSNWNDIKNNIKGVHHKFLLINLARALSKREDIVIATPSSTPDKIKQVSGKIAEQTPRLLAFSVDKGLRIKYKQMFNGDEPVEIDGKPVFQEISVATSDYVKKLDQIYSYIFGLEPTKRALEKMKSFLGLCDLMEKKVDKSLIIDTFNFIVNENLFGKRAQVLEKNNPILDRKVKQAMVDKLFVIFPYLKSEESHVNNMANEYYKNKE